MKTRKIISGVSLLLASFVVLHARAATGQPGDGSDANRLPNPSFEEKEGDGVLQQVAEPPVDTQATATIEPGARSIPYSPMIFGGFLEHFDHQVYGGVFDPGSPLSDRKGFRRDVIVALKELKVPVVRWPGGCYVSGYHWETGVGKTRKPTDDMAWGVIEPNTFGTDEYIELCRLLN